MKNTIGKAWFVVSGIVLAWLCVGAASAQATRTWVSGVGDDANPCSRTAPCKTFAGSISKTAAGGVINVLDPGGFGGVTITKAITIEAVGDVAGVLVSGTNGIIVNAGVNDVVVLRNLSLHGVGTGLNGINFLAGKSLIVDGCVIESFTGDGISFKPSGAASLVVRNTLIRSVASGSAGNGAAIQIAPGATGSANLAITGLTVSDAVNGVRLTGVANGSVRDSVFADNSMNGVFAFGANTVELSLDRITVQGSSNYGLLAQGNKVVFRLADSSITRNANGVLGWVGAKLLSAGNNRISGNTVDGTPTGPIGLL
jgi:hypothetical protein